MKVTNLRSGGFPCNTYVLGEENEPCLVFDFGENKNNRIFSYIEKHHQGKCLGIFLTHSHYDHIMGLAEVKKPLPCPLFIHPDDFDDLEDPSLNYSAYLCGEDIRIEGFEPYFVDDEDEISVGPYLVKVIHTPFHTYGSVCYYLEKEKILFSGDTLFRLTVGRSDLKGSCPRYTAKSLSKLARLIPDEVKVYPGHGLSTLMGFEKAHNPEMKG